MKKIVTIAILVAITVIMSIFPVMSTATVDRICPKCGTELDADQVYCTNCGEKWTEKVCKNCGAELGEEDNYCPQCGASTLEGMTIFNYVIATLICILGIAGITVGIYCIYLKMKGKGGY